MWWSKKDINFDDIPDMACDYFNTPKGKWAKLNDEKLKYLIEESRIFLQTLWDAYGRLTQKALFLLGYIIALLGYISNKVIFKQEIISSMSWQAILFIFIYIALLIYIFFHLIKYLLPICNVSAGGQPKDLFKKDFMNCDFEEMAVNQLHHYQRRIWYSERLNVILSNRIKYYFGIILIYPIIVISAFLFLHFLH